MTTQILPNGKQSFFDNNGDPLVSGTVTFYEPGTTTFKDTWQDQAKTTLNTNPITLDAAGRCVAWGDGLYRQIVKDSLGNTIWDQVTNQLDSSSAGAVLWGGVSTGTANAQVLTVDDVPVAIEGHLIGWIAGFTNTDELTIQIVDAGAGDTGALAVLKGTSAGPVALEGGEIIAGNLYVIAYDDSLNAFQLTSHVDIETTNTVQKLILEPSLSTTLLTANTNNWNPTGLANYTRVKISSDQAIDLTGITAVATGTLLLLENWGAFAITLKANDVLSLAQNRFDYPSDVVLGADENIMLVYDGAWRVYQARAVASGAAAVTDTSVPQVIIEHLLSAGTSAGDVVAGVWTTRPLNTLTRNVGTLASLASNEFTLPAGTYHIEWESEYVVGTKRSYFLTRLRNITDGTTVATSILQKYTKDGNAPERRGDGGCVVTIAGAKAFAIQYIAENGETSGLGLGSAGPGEQGLFARVKIWGLV